MVAFGGALVVAGITIMLVVSGVRRAPVAGAAFVVASLPEGKQELAFSDGSRVTVAPGGRLRVDRATTSDVAMRLEAGRARFEVKHDAVRRFLVAVDDFEVIDRGTRFEIARGDDVRPGIEVRVEEGEVELRDPSHPEPRRLTAGESWSNRAPEMANAPLPSNEPAAPTVGPAVANPGSPSGASTPRASKGGGAADGDAPRGSTEPARELFERGNLAKLEGRLQEAADAFDALRLRYRTDGHAALAALELGRLRLNHLGDPAGALAALQDAIKLGPRAPFREEAEARIVDAFATLGRGSECARAREQFLARHPRSVHAAAVAGKCDVR
jgi:tetratricopeptide (TPR) repeat protein